MDRAVPCGLEIDPPEEQAAASPLLPTTVVPSGRGLQDRSDQNDRRSTDGATREGQVLASCQCAKLWDTG